MRNEQDWYAGGWQQTFTGKRFFPLDPRIEEICIEDIAHGLSHGAYRFAGQCDDPYTVAQHCCMVSDYCTPWFKLEGLMHDAAEGYLGDLSRPLKHSALMAAFREIEKRVQDVINEAFDLPCTPEISSYVKALDNRAVVTEKLHLFTRQLPRVTTGGFEPLPVAYITVWGAKQAEEEFLERFYKLQRERISL
jgi:cytochrome P450